MKPNQISINQQYNNQQQYINMNKQLVIPRLIKKLNSKDELLALVDYVQDDFPDIEHLSDNEAVKYILNDLKIPDLGVTQEFEF